LPGKGGVSNPPDAGSLRAIPAARIGGPFTGRDPQQFLKQLLAVATIACSALAAAEPGVTDSTITLGMSSPFTGPNGVYGVDMRQVIQAYFGQVNKGGRRQRPQARPGGAR
jgi:ABC-type branched-subunit amino acid transport system substrate-binding protein